MEAEVKRSFPCEGSRDTAVDSIAAAPARVTSKMVLSSGGELLVYVDGSHVMDTNEPYGRGGSGVFVHMPVFYGRTNVVSAESMDISMAIPVPLPRLLDRKSVTHIAYDALRAEIYAAVAALYRLRGQPRLMIKSDCQTAVVLLRTVQNMSIAPRDYLSHPCRLLHHTFSVDFSFTGRDDVMSLPLSMMMNETAGTSRVAVPATTKWDASELARYVDVLDTWWELSREWMSSAARAKGWRIQVEWVPSHTHDPLELAAKRPLSRTSRGRRGGIASVDPADSLKDMQGNEIADQLARRARDKVYWNNHGRQLFSAFPLYPPHGLHSQIVFERTANLLPSHCWEKEDRPLLYLTTITAAASTTTTTPTTSTAAVTKKKDGSQEKKAAVWVPEGDRLFSMWNVSEPRSKAPLYDIHTF